MRRVIVPLFLLLTTAWPVGVAWACSCVMEPPEQFVAAADGPVFVGTLVGRAPAGGDEFGQPALAWTFEVETVLSGELTETVTVVAAEDSGANCGLAMDPGARIGMKLHPSGDGWSSSSCSVRDAGQLLAVSDGEPPLAGETSPDPVQASYRPVPWPAAVGTVVAAVAVLGAIVALARRRRAPS